MFVATFQQTSRSRIPISEAANPTTTATSAARSIPFGGSLEEMLSFEVLWKWKTTKATTA
ncbi:hypothetical protein CRG98_048556, partial [Punica granatum]